MKRISYFLCIIIVIMITVGCGEKEGKIEDNLKTVNSEEKAEENIIAEQENIDEVKKDGDVEIKEPEKSEELKGLDLINSTEVEKIDNYMIDYEIDMKDVGTSKMLMYYDNNSTRMETTNPMYPGKIIVIFNSEDGVMYQYTEGQSTGIMMKNTDEMGNDDFEMWKIDEYSLDNYLSELNENVIAKNEILDGKEVLYIETNENTGEIIKIWFSKKYGLPLKYEIYSDSNIVMSMKITNMKINTKLDSNLFIKPKNIDFFDFSLNNMEDMIDSENVNDLLDSISIE